MGEWFTLSWSKFNMARKCLKRYDWNYNQYKDPPMRDSKHFAVIGSVVQRVYEYYYEYQVYKRNHRAADILLEKTEEFFEEYLDNNYVNFGHVTCPYDRDEALAKCKECVENTEVAVNREGLIGNKNFAEAVIQVPFQRNKYGKVALKSRLDFIIQKGSEDEPLHYLLDGKSTSKPERVEEDQLVFYTLLFTMRYKSIPEKVGFLFFRYADDPEKAIKWLDVDKNRLMAMKQEVTEVVRMIKTEEDWKATPEPSYCRWCPYEKICDERQSQKSDNRRSKMSDDAKAIDDHLRENGGGVISLSEIRNDDG